MHPLHKLAIDQFGKLTAAEQKLLDAIPSGQMAECGSPDQSQNDPNNAVTWAEDRTIRSSIIRWVCTNKEALSFIDSLGIKVRGARFTGELNLAALSVNFSLAFYKCAIPDGISIHDASLRTLDLSGTVCAYLLGWDLNLTGNLLLRYEFRSHGPVFLSGASIRGDLECINARFGEPTSSPVPAPGIALPPDVIFLADRISIGRRITMREMQAHGIVQLVDATISGAFDCQDAVVTIALNLRDAQSRSMNFGGCECPYVIADRLQVKGSLFMRKSAKKNFKSVGAVVMHNLNISGDFDCRGGVFGSQVPDRKMRSRVEKYAGSVPETALTLNGSTIGGYVFLADGFRVYGGANLNGATIALNLICNGGNFFNAGKNALQCQFGQIKGAALFRTIYTGPFQTDGFVNLFSATIAGSVSFTGARFVEALKTETEDKNVDTKKGEATNGLRLQNAQIAGALQLNMLSVTPSTELNLAHLKIGQLEDDEKTWPEDGKLILDGFSYDAIAGVPLNTSKRKDWLNLHLEYLKRQSKSRFSLQPHRQLADILRKSGYEDDARDVLIDMHKAQREQGGFSKFGRVWSWILQGTIGFGYRSYRTFLWGLAFVVLGMVLFNAGYQAGYLVPPKPDAKASQFSALGYSLDSFLPIINLHQEELWVISGEATGRLLQYYYWMHICLGWALVTLGVAGFTGLIRKE